MLKIISKGEMKAMNNEVIVNRIFELVEGLNHLYQASNKLSHGGTVQVVISYFEPIKAEYREGILESLKKHNDKFTKEQLLELKDLALNTILKFEIDKLIAD